MSERAFRLIAGLALWAILLYSIINQNDTLLIAFCGLFLLEGITNWRVPLVINRIRYGKNKPEKTVTIVQALSTSKKFIPHIEAERVMRFMVVFFLLISYFTFPDILWFFPWYVAGMLIVSGITNICPILMFLRWVGFR